MPRLMSVYPISGEDTLALPVRTLEPAIAFYQKMLGFSLTRQDGTTAQLSRDEIRLGLIVQKDHDPARAGSLAFRVDDLDAMHRELEGSGGRPGAFGVDAWGGQSHRTFFVREDENGYCYCFHQPLQGGGT